MKIMRLNGGKTMKTILCIDDNPLLLRASGKLLEENGYKVLLASNGRDGLELIKSDSVDCVILDYQMPGMSGAAVVEHMASLESPQPVILVSGLDPPLELLEQVDGFLAKPFLAEDLLECIDDVMCIHEEKEQDEGRQQDLPRETNACAAD
jgi:CheY-like chemotaxis protein